MSGALKSGEAIPSVRQLSTEYRLNPQTVLNATQLLVAEGLLDKQRGRGYFVTDSAKNVVTESALIEFKNVIIPDMIKQAGILKISKNELYKLIDEGFDK